MLASLGNSDSRALEAEVDQEEVKEWLESFGAVLEREGVERARRLLEQLVAAAETNGVELPFRVTSSYVNTIGPEEGAVHPGELELEERLCAYVRWNAMAMVVRQSRAHQADGGDLGGHISSFASVATLFETGFNHFWRAESAAHGGDLLYFQGHSSPGVYARAFLEGRLTEAQLGKFRQEAAGGGLPSYPHPQLLPNFWQFPTVSMGLGPHMAIYQARFLKYLHARGIADTADRKVWAFCGDGEMDEPEILGSIGIAAREKLDNLIFVVNCNLQRLDGPVRGNGKIVQELEGAFRGSGWNVLKVLWGSNWDPLFQRDTEGLLRRVMEETLDGDYQAFRAKDAQYLRSQFFGRDPRLLELVADMSDAELWQLTRGGHDPTKVYSAFRRAVDHTGQPTVILVKTVKGYGMGPSGESKNTAHQTKKLKKEDVIAFRDRFALPISDEDAANVAFCSPAEGSPELEYLHARRQALGGYLPSRRSRADEDLPVPDLAVFKSLLEPTAEGRLVSTTQAYVQFVTQLLRDDALGPRVVPILVDEARTFGMEGLFRRIAIYNPSGQRYTPVDRGEVMYYREDAHGQILQEGINEAGGMSSWIAAATSYSTCNRIMIPFYIFYSMFGFQRVGDLCWAAGDSQARGFLLGGTSGRTTLNGEGLQHQDGHSQVLASVIPNCVSYDPTFMHEVAVILHSGLVRMVKNQENVFFYLTLLNENYAHVGLEPGTEEQILKGMYRVARASDASSSAPCVNLLGSGAILREAMFAKELLESDWGVSVNVWSCTSFTELARDGQECERVNRLRHDAEPRVPFVSAQLAPFPGPIVAATDYVRAYPEQIRPFVPAGRTYKVLGTDGFGRSDFRSELRRHFEIDRYHIAHAALVGLVEEGKLQRSVALDALARYPIDGRRVNPFKA